MIPTSAILSLVRKGCAKMAEWINVLFGVETPEILKINTTIDKGPYAHTVKWMQV